MIPPHPGHVFGPVPSRRLGRSLGVDLMPFKTCSYDCIYCQLGRTRCKTLERKEWVPTGAVLEEVKRNLRVRPDYITLSGSGEPTLHSCLGEIIEHLQAMTAVPVAVLTNGSLLWQAEVRAELASADVVLPSLDAGDATKFEFINRPHPGLSFEQVVDGLAAFRREYTGQYWLEVFLLAGYTALPADVDRIAALVKRIRPDRVQLNTVARPPVESFAFAASLEELNRLAGRFRPRAEVVLEAPASRGCSRSRLGPSQMVAMLSRRPCTAEEVAQGLGMHRVQVLKHLEQMTARSEVEQTQHGGEVFYFARTANSPAPQVSQP